MKRVVISLAILVLMTAVCVTGLLYLRGVKDELLIVLEQIRTTAEGGDHDRAADLIAEFGQLWRRRESVLIRYIRHHQIDEITITVARLEPLLRNGDIAEFLAELTKTVRLVEQIWASEIPNMTNIF